MSVDVKVTDISKDSKDIECIVLKFSDGTEERVDRGIVIEEVEGSDHEGEINMKMTPMTGKEFLNIMNVIIAGLLEG